MTWEPERSWEGQDAFLIGGGASLRSFDFNLLKGLNTLGCNDAFRLGEEVIKYCIFGDASWFQKTKFELEKYKGEIFSCAPSLMSLQTTMFHHLIRKSKDLHDGNAVGWNFSTGAAAINLAINLGAKRIFLLGYDLRLTGDKSHWHDYRHSPTRDVIFGRFLKGFKTISNDLPRYGVEVIHVCDGSSPMPFFLQMPFSEFHHVLNRVKTEEVAA